MTESQPAAGLSRFGAGIWTALRRWTTIEAVAIQVAGHLPATAGAGAVLGKVAPVADDQQYGAKSIPEPYFEPIGPRSAEWFQPADDDDGGARRRGPGLRAEVRAGAADWAASLGTLRFWAVAVGSLCATWVVVAGLVILPGPGGDSTEWMPAPMLTYVLGSSLLPATAALTAVHWGMSAQVGAAGHEHGGRLPAAVLAAALRSLVFALLILLTLLMQGAAAGLPGALAATSAGLAAVEGAIFAGIGVAVAALVRHRFLRRLLGWSLAVFMVAGTVAAASFLVPAVRSEEPVTVALNVVRAADGTPVAYDCSGIALGTVELYRTERVTWLATASPTVVFVALAGELSAGADQLGWLSAALQQAAAGTAVPCINGEPRSLDSPRLPLPVLGLLLQTGVAAALLATAAAAARRRNPIQGA